MKNRRSPFALLFAALLLSGCSSLFLKDPKAFGIQSYPEQRLFKAGDAGGAAYWRIPSLINTQKGTLIAAIDKHWQHNGDWGDNDTAIRISHDQGKSWSEIRTIINLVSQQTRNAPILKPKQRKGFWDTEPYMNSAFTIDPVLLQDGRNHRIFMAVDMFPESRGFFSINNPAGNGNGHLRPQNKDYLRLNRPDKTVWTLRENGEVFDDLGNKTDYRVITEGDPRIAFRDLGDIYQHQVKLGNIYLKISGSNANAPFTITQTSYLWLLHSDDEGKNWSSPRDITAQVKKPWMRFLGTAPGIGIQTQKGDLIFPVYYTNENSAQSPALIISQDGGNTWQLGPSPNDSRSDFAEKGWNSRTMKKYLNKRNVELSESQVVELPNGDLKLFMRNGIGKVMVATSKTGGFSWLPELEQIDELNNPHSQISVLKYSHQIDGKTYILFSGPSETEHEANGRRNGKLFLGEVTPEGDIEWDEDRNKTIISNGNGGIYSNGYAYSVMAELNDGKIGLLYENTTHHTSVVYQPIEMQEFFWKEGKILRNNKTRPFDD